MVNVLAARWLISRRQSLDPFSLLLLFRRCLKFQIFLIIDKNFSELCSFNLSNANAWSTETTALTNKVRWSYGWYSDCAPTTYSCPTKPARDLNLSLAT